MSQSKTNLFLYIGLISLSLLLASCSSQRAPIIERSNRSHIAPTLSGVTSVEPGFYRVKYGDTLYRIALESGQSYRDIAQWNNLSNPDQIEIGQVLRVIPPHDNSMPTAGIPVKSGTVEMRPLPNSHVAQTKDKVLIKESLEKNPAKEAKPLAKEGTDITFAWPAQGTVVFFDEIKNKGIDIMGKIGDPVRAAGNGKVVYAGSGLRGYGHLIIIKHNGIYLTAYAHNRVLLVKEGEQVNTGQKIAEMGNSDTDNVKLHFEVRRYGKPIDPIRYLPEKNL